MKRLAIAWILVAVFVAGCGSGSNDGQEGISITATQSVAWEGSEDHIEFNINIGSPNQTSGNIAVYFEPSGSALDRVAVSGNPDLQKGYVEIPPGSRTATIIIQGIKEDGIVEDTQTISLTLTGCSSRAYPAGIRSEATAVVMDGDGPVVTDIEGNVYHTVLIGTQTWMVKNLVTSTLNDNTRLRMRAYNMPGFCWYDFNRSEFGFLYNWAAVSTGKLCPSGWHVPTDAEWSTLIEYLGGVREAGGKMKTPHMMKTSYGVYYSTWELPDTGATNSSGFTGFPGGVGIDDLTFSPYPVFSHFGYYGIWWSSTESEYVTPGPGGLQHMIKTMVLGYDTAAAVQTAAKKTDYCSVRCIQD